MKLKKKVLVTGVAGFIGRIVAEECLKMGFDVVGLDDLSGGFEENIPNGVRFVKGSVCNDKLVTKLAEKEKFDYIYHLAAYAAEGLSHFIRRFNYGNNLVGSATLINAAILSEVKCFVFTSSIAVYGKNQLPMTEELTPHPEDPYGISKYAVELDLEAAHEMFGLNYVIFRPHNVYGEYQNIADKYRNVIGIFMNQVMRNEPMTIFGDGKQTRAFSYIRDISQIIAKAPFVEAAQNQVFNIGADKPYTVLELAQEVAMAFGVEPKIQFLPPRKEVLHAFASHAKTERIFGKANSTNIREGIQKMAGWARKAVARKPVEFKNIELTKNLPPSWVQKKQASTTP